MAMGPGALPDHPAFIFDGEELKKEQEIFRIFMLQKVVLEMLKDRGMRLPNPQMLEMSFDAFREQFNGSTMDELFDPVYTSPGLTTGEGCIVVKHMRPSPQSGSESISADDLKQFLSPGGQFQVSTQAIESGKHRAIIITKVKLSSAFEDLIRSENEKGQFIIEHFLEKELGFNITKHSLVPQHEKLTPEQKKELLRRYKLAESHLPRVHKSDPIARYFGMQKGDVFRIVRPSETAGRYVTYRIVL